MAKRSSPLLLLLLVKVFLCARHVDGLTPIVEEEERLIGWKGESYIPTEAAAAAAGGDGGGGDSMGMGMDVESAWANPWIERIAWEPRVFLFHNFLRASECEHLISVARPLVRQSQVVNSSSGGSYASKVRTSSGAFLTKGGDETIRMIEKRIADYTFIPAENGEELHVLHYEPGQEYQAHFDYFHDEINTQNGGQRVATVLMYLSDVDEGGETTFPAADTDTATVRIHSDASVSACARGQLAVRPRRGDALLFWNLRPDTTLDPKSLHAGCPVVRGNKWSATKWIRLHARA